MFAIVKFRKSPPGPNLSFHHLLMEKLSVRFEAFADGAGALAFADGALTFAGWATGAGGVDSFAAGTLSFAGSAGGAGGAIVVFSGAAGGAGWDVPGAAGGADVSLGCAPTGTASGCPVEEAGGL